MANRSKNRSREIKPALPPYVVMKYGAWHVRLNFPTDERDSRGRIKYLQPTRPCIPETAERAEELAEEMRAEYEALLLGEPELPDLVGPFLEYYLAKKKPSVERRTHEHDNDLYNRYVKDTSFARRGLGEIEQDPTLVQDFFDELLGRKVSPTMLRKTRVFLSSAFNQGIKWKILAESPTSSLILPKVKKTPAPAMTKAEVKRFRDVCRQNDEYIVFDFALATAMRPQEYLALQLPELDLDRNRARVVQALAIGFKGGGFELKDPKTDASFRSIPFSDDVADRLRVQVARIEKWKKDLGAIVGRPILLEHMKRKGANYKKRLHMKEHAREILANLSKYNLVFPSAEGKPISRENLNNRDFKEALKAAKIDPKRYSLKSLRTTCGTLLAEHISPKRLQQFMGHSRIETTMEFYVYVDDRDQVDISNKFEEALS